MGWEALGYHEGIRLESGRSSISNPSPDSAEMGKRLKEKMDLKESDIPFWSIGLTHGPWRYNRAHERNTSLKGEKQWELLKGENIYLLPPKILRRRSKA